MPKILVVEENKKISSLISSYLRKKGFETDSVEDGVNAVRFFLSNVYDALLVDIELPFTSGVNVCRKIRASEKGKNIPIVMMSMTERDPAATGGIVRELGLNGFLSRPFTYEAMHNLISSALSAPTDAPVKTAETSRQPMKASLETTRFEKVLFYLLKRRATGTLTLTKGPMARTFHFIDGGPVELELAGDDHFGSYLSRRNLADAAELQEYETALRRGGPDPRELFVKMGCLTPEQFIEENRKFLCDKIVDCFSWTSGSLMFQSQQTFIEALTAASIAVPLLFYRGFKAHLPSSMLSHFMEDRANKYIGRSADWYELQNYLADLDGVEVFDGIDGSKTAAQIAAISDAEDTPVILYTLDYLKLISFTDTPCPTAAGPVFPVRKRSPRQRNRETEAFVDLDGELSELADEVAAIEGIAATRKDPAESAGQAVLEEELKAQWEAIKDKDYYGIFGMTRNSFSFDKLKKSYFQFTNSFGPDKFFASSGEIMHLAEEFLSKISNAYETLTNVVSKENYDEMIASREQMPTTEDDKEFYEQIQFQSGKVFIEQGQYDSAEKAFTNCLNIDPRKPEYLAYLALAIYNNPANRGNPAAVKRARDTVNKSLQIGKLSIAYALRGTMYLDEGSINFAEAEFNKSLKLNPNNKTALKGLETIGQKREEAKKGLFHRMFR